MAEEANNVTAITAVPTKSSGLGAAAFGYAPQTFEQAWKLAEMIAKSDLAPKDFKGKPENTFIAMQMGAEIGLPPLSAIQNIAVINGRPSVWGDSMLALVVSHRDYEWHKETMKGEGDSRAATHEIKRRGHDLHGQSFSIADAKRAGLWGKQGPWTQYPERMLTMRARGFALRDKFADALRGMISREEAQDWPGQTIEATTTPVVEDPESQVREQCDKLMVAAGMNQAQRAAKLSQNKGKMAELLKRLQNTAAKSKGETNEGTTSSHRSNSAPPAVSEVAPGDPKETSETAASVEQPEASAPESTPVTEDPTTFTANDVRAQRTKEQPGFKF